MRAAPLCPKKAAGAGGAAAQNRAAHETKLASRYTVHPSTGAPKRAQVDGRMLRRVCGRRTPALHVPVPVACCPKPSAEGSTAAAASLTAWWRQPRKANDKPRSCTPSPQRITPRQPLCVMQRQPCRQTHRPHACRRTTHTAPASSIQRQAPRRQRLCSAD